VSVDIENVERTISAFPWLACPDHVYILDAPLLFEGGKRVLLIRGATPVGGSAIILTPQADEKTILEEIFHTYGLHEPGAKLLSRLSLIKLNWFPNLRGNFVKYAAVACAAEELAQFGIRGLGSDMRPRHYVLQIP